MKLALLLLLASAGYYTTSRVYITGPADLTVQASTASAQDYFVQASASDLGAISISGDAAFSIDTSACVGVRFCNATVTVYADTPGDYTATIRASSISGRWGGLPVHGSTSELVVTAHVAAPTE